MNWQQFTLKHNAPLKHPWDTAVHIISVPGHRMALCFRLEYEIGQMSAQDLAFKTIGMRMETLCFLISAEGVWSTGVYLC